MMKMNLDNEPFANPITNNYVHPCFVGSGECSNQATHWLYTGDADGSIEYVCARHVEEMEAWEDIFKNLSPEKFKKLEAAVEEEHKKL